MYLLFAHVFWAVGFAVIMTVNLFTKQTFFLMKIILPAIAEVTQKIS